MLLILSLLLQLALDHVRLPPRVIVVQRIIAPLAAVLVSGGFFGIAHLPALAVLLYLGVACVVGSTLITGIGLLRTSRTA